MSRDSRDRLNDVLDSVRAIRAHVQQLPLSEDVVFDAVRMRLIEIGESINALPNELLATQPSIPWSDIVGMRHFLTHHYFDTLFDDVNWVIEHDLEPLEAAVNAMLCSLRTLVDLAGKRGISDSRVTRAGIRESADKP
jgi:uncharacterized protein with HEPN domain